MNRWKPLLNHPMRCYDSGELAPASAWYAPLKACDHAVVTTLLRRRGANRLLVLGWHNVESTWCFSSPGDSGPRGFRAQLSLLARVANVLPLRTALAELQSGEPLPPRACALTFDDGYTDNLTVVAPLLAELGLPATFFLVSGLLSRSAQAWWEDAAHVLASARAEALDWGGRRWSLRTPDERRRVSRQIAEELKRLNSAERVSAIDEMRRLLGVEHIDTGTASLFLDWSEAQQLAEMGFDVGSHTVTHPILATESEGRVRQEIHDARAQLQDRLARPVDLLAYPNGRVGDYDSRAVVSAERAGHSHAVTTVPGFAQPGARPFEVPRCVLSPEGGIRELLAAVREARGVASRP